MSDVDDLSKSEGAGFDPEMAECPPSTWSLEIDDSPPQMATVSQTPIRPEQSFEGDDDPEIIQALEHHIRTQLPTVVAEVDSLRADLRDDGLCCQSLELRNMHLKILFRDLFDQTFSLRVQIEQLLNEVDILKAKRKRRLVHRGDGEGAALAKGSGIKHDTCSDELDQSHMRVPHEKHGMSTTNYHSSPRRTNLASNTHAKADSCNFQRKVQKSNIFFAHLSKVFRRNKR